MGFSLETFLLVLIQFFFPQLPTLNQYGYDVFFINIIPLRNTLKIDLMTSLFRFLFSYLHIFLINY